MAAQTWWSVIFDEKNAVFDILVSSIFLKTVNIDFA